MRKILFFLVFCVMTTSLFAVPQAFRYQAVVRDNTGAVVADRDMQIRVHIIYEGSIAPVYTETFATRSNAFGMINLEIGHGTPEGGSSFEDIQWGDGAHFVQLEINIGGTSGGFVNMGRAQLLSVPYALFAANAGASDAGGYWELGPGDLDLRNVNPRTVFIGHGAYPDGWPGSTPARLHVAGSIGLGTLGGGGFLINAQTADLFHIGALNNIAGSTENIFVLGADNTANAGNALVFGQGNTVSGLNTNMSLLIGRGNQANSALDNILIGHTLVSNNVDNAIALGTNLNTNLSSTFIGRNILGTHPLNTSNIALGHGITMLPLAGTGTTGVTESILIGNDIAPTPATAHLFSANRTIAIGNQIHPHGGGTPGPTTGHNTINIGNVISTRSPNSINIGNTITSVGGDVFAEHLSNTIAIGRNITFPTVTPAPADLRLVDNNGAIILGTSFPGLFPSVAGLDAPTVEVPRIVRPRFVVGGHATFTANVPAGNPMTSSPAGGPGTPIHFLYIDDFANAYFGTISHQSAGGGVPNIVVAPPLVASLTGQGVTAQPMPTFTGGTVFGRQFVGLHPPATVSDSRLKKNIVPLGHRNITDATPHFAPLSAPRFTTTFFVDALSNIGVYSFNYNFASADPRDVWGFMAQDVLPHFPHLIQSFDGENLSMMHEGFIPILWSIAQDQQAQIEEQQARIIELEERLRRIEAALGLD